MQERHHNRQKYFEEQAYTTEKHVLPFIEEAYPLEGDLRILEVGCGEGGNLKPFLERGFRVWGVDLSASKIQNGQTFYQDHPLRDQLQLKATDVFQFRTEKKFHLIFLRDVLEHIHGQEDFLASIGDLLEADGRLFLGFPPWINPFGGHQQICRSRFLSRLPFLHLLPRPLYRKSLKLAGESEATLAALMEIRDTGIGIQRFLRICRKTGWKIQGKTYYLINPNYEIKMGLKPRKLFFPLSAVPRLRELFITTSYFLLAKSGNES